MRVTLVAAALVLMGVGGAGFAAAGEEAYALDLSMIPGGSMYFIKCSKSPTLLDCGIVSLWEQTNGHPGLQSTIVVYGQPPRPIDPDFSLLP